MAPSPGHASFLNSFRQGLFGFFVPGLPDCALIASDEDHRCDEEERCTDHQNIQGMCESHGYLLAFADRYYDLKKRIGKAFCCCVATSGIRRALIHNANLLNFLLYRGRHKKFTIPTR
ncbi:protein of unknown function [Shinella sp. WSC3-e]|nr:hypothetical protein SHINE37_42226 [Rhizobiaceae bacterium]CAK7256819.1 protein of unknown function [Shinella sp. WSC3-e]